MDIQQLKNFVAIASQQSFTRAAEQLFITQPMLTRCIKSLEAELGVKLIERTSKFFRLTDAGEALYDQATQLLGQYQDIFRTIDDVKQAQLGQVRISSPGVLLDMYFPPLLTDFRRENPGIDISIVEEGSKLTAQAVMRGEVDIGLVMLPVDNLVHMEVIPVVSDEVGLLVKENHPFADKSVVHIGGLKDMDIMTYSDTTTLHDSVIKMCVQQGFQPKIAYKSLMPIFAMEMVSLGSCIGVFPCPMIQRYKTEGLAMVRLDPQFPWEIAVVLKKGRYQSFATVRLKNFIEQYFWALGHQGAAPEQE